MELAPVRRRVPVPFPAALLPALAILVTLLGTASGVSGIALLRFLRARARDVREISRKLSRELSRTISNRLLAKIREPRVLSRRNIAGGSLAVLLFEALRRLRGAMRESLSLMNPVEESLDAGLAERRLAVTSKRPWGHGLPQPPRPGQWRPYLHKFKSARENLEEVHGSLGIPDRAPEALTLDQLAEGIRRILLMKYSPLVIATGRYWSEEQAHVIAKALAAECGLPDPLPRGGLDEVVPTGVFDQVPWVAPRWLQLSQRLGIAALRPIFLHAWSWTSRWVQTPFGALHVYDALPPAGARREEGADEEPPLLLQHGLFVTGWSMALLGWLLCRRGRRVIMPDLFDFDHGLSASDGAKAGDEKVRRTPHTVEALMCVIRDILEGGASQLDICGHSFGGYVASVLAARCELEGLPLRKVVLLGPGGPFDFINNSPMVVRFMNKPMETIDENLRPRVLAAAAKAAAKCFLGVLLSPNNANFILGLPYCDYLGSIRIGSAHPTLLLWGNQDSIACPRKPSGLGPFLREHFPRLDGYWVRGGGHNIQIDSAVALARAMDAWLRGGAEGGGGLAERLLFPLDAALEPMELSGREEVWPHQREGKRSETSRSRL